MSLSHGRLHDFECIGGGGGWSMSRCLRCGEEGIGGCWLNQIRAFLLPWWFGCRPTAKVESYQHPEMSSSEYDMYWRCGLMPERFWQSEADKLADQYARDELTMQQLNDSLDDMMGITLAEQRASVAPRGEYA